MNQNKIKSFLLLCILSVLVPYKSGVAEDIIVKRERKPDQKVISATIESADVVQARARLNGTITKLNVKEGDLVKQGDIIGVVVDDKLALQVASVDSQAQALDAEIIRAKANLNRMEYLTPRGIAPQASLDQARAEYDVALNTKKSILAQRDVVKKQSSDGTVLAPVAGRVLKVPVTEGSVIMSGEPLATIASEHYVLRIELPERHARLIKLGDTVDLDGSDLATGMEPSGKITTIYPQTEGGRVIADAVVNGIDDYYVGERVRVWIKGEPREQIIIPKDYIQTKLGMDFVYLRNKEKNISEVPVQLGLKSPSGIEILSGLKDGDVLVKP